MADRKLEIKIHSIGDDYTVHWNRKLGSGISGPVRICTSKETGTQYALKCLTDRPKARKEVDLHYKCSGHPYIVGVVDVYANEIIPPGEVTPKSCLLMVMELMQGGELFDRIRKKVSFTEKEGCQITKQIVLGVQHIHALNVAHRDLKPENLLLKDKSERVIVKLADFGFAKVDNGNLMTPQFTPYYVSPQVLEAQKFHRAQKLGHIPAGSQPYTYNKSCDLWSLGVVIYIMLCGYPPFYSENPKKQLSQGMKRRIMSGDYDFPSPEWSKISEHGKDFVKKLLNVNASERLTIDGCLKHPWLSSNNAPDTQLHSPHYMLDQAAFNEAMDTHAAILTDMRLPDSSFVLKKSAFSQNPIIQKRMLKDQNSNGTTVDKSPTIKTRQIKNEKNDIPGVQPIREVIAFCYMPPRSKLEEFEGHLQGLVLSACHSNPTNNELRNVLAKETWNGNRFSGSVNRLRLAKNLSDVLLNIRQMNNNNNHRSATACS